MSIGPSNTDTVVVMCLVAKDEHEASEPMATKEYTPEEVAQHNKEDDLWAIWHGKVLDLTAFVHEHPGGLDVLMESAGADASQAFDDIGHSDDAFRIAEEHQIGVLKGARDAGKPQGNSGAPIVTVKKVEAKTDSSGYILPLALVALAILAYYYYAR